MSRLTGTCRLMASIKAAAEPLNFEGRCVSTTLRQSKKSRGAKAHISGRSRPQTHDEYELESMWPAFESQLQRCYACSSSI